MCYINRNIKIVKRLKMGPIPEASLRKEKPIFSDIFWASHFVETMSMDASHPLCDPNNNGDGADCVKSNFTLEGPIVSIPNETDPYFDWDMMGDRQDPYALSMTVVYTIIFISGLIGNICTCIVIHRNRYMHTATNYYLFSLAVSDLMLLGLGLPQDINHLWSKYPYLFGEVFCILRGWTSETSTNASILTITAFTIERYLAICHPLKAHTMSRLSRSLKLICIIWMCSGIAAVAVGYQLGIIYEQDSLGNDVMGTAICTVKRELRHSFEWSTAMFFFIPGSIILILYVLIGVQLKRSTKMGRNTNGCRSNKSVSVNANGPSKLYGKFLSNHGKNAGRKSSSSSRKDVIKMLVAVVIAFFICWAPFHAQRLMAAYVQEPTDTDFLIYSYLTNISGVCYYISATINPILYSILSLKFRHAFRDTLGRCWGNDRGPRRRTLSLFNSTLKSGLTEDVTVVSEMTPDHHYHHHLNGSGQQRKMTRIQMVHLRAKEDGASHVPRKKTSSTISDVSLQMEKPSIDVSATDFIDKAHQPAMTSTSHVLRKKTSSTISNDSVNVVESFDDTSVTEFIDKIKETRA